MKQQSNCVECSAARAGQDRTGQDRAGQDRTGQGRAGREDRTVLRALRVISPYTEGAVLQVRKEYGL